MPNQASEIVQPRPTAQKILPLTSLRFLAALFVVLYHLSSEVGWLERNNLLGRTVKLGYTSVPFFFVLSGFVLAVAYLKSDRLIHTRNFLIARFARIYPALFACLLLDLPHFVYTEVRISHHSMLRIAGEVLASFAAIEAWFSRTPLLDVPSWSIGAEFFFYLIFPFVAVSIWRMRAKYLWILAVALYLSSNLVLWSFIRPGIDLFRLERNPISHVPEFLIGICLARLVHFTSQHLRWGTVVQRYSPIIALLSVAAFLAIPALALNIPETLLQHARLVPIFVGLIFAFSSGNKTIQTLFSPKWFVILGEASFALYLVHMPVMMLCWHQIRRHQLWFPVVFCTIVVLLSVASFFWLETPARMWILSRTHTRSREDLTTQAVAQ